MKVAVVIPTHYNLKSSLHILLSAYRYLIKTRKIEVTLFTDSNNILDSKETIYKNFNIVKIRGIDYKTPLEKVLFLLGIPRFYYTDLVKKLKGYDVIETSNPEFYGFAYQSYKAAKKYKSRLVLRTSQTVNGFFLFKLSKYLVVPIVKRVYSYASSLIFTNPEAAQRCLNLGLVNNTKKFIISGHGVDTKLFKPMNLKKDEKNKELTLLLSVGGLYKIKGHHLIIMALKKIIDNGYKNIELMIVGEGYYKKKLVNLVSKLGLQEHVIFLGSISNKKLPMVYNKADIFVLANYQEMTPAVNEAMACGIPVVVMDCGGREFVIPDESYGLIAKRFDVDDLSNKIIMLINDKNTSKKIAENGKLYITKKFDIKAYSSKLYSALNTKQ